MIWGTGRAATLTLTLAGTAVLLAAPSTAHACTCASRACGVLGPGAVLFEATVNRIERATPADPFVVELTDIRVIGGGTAPVTVLGGDGVDCGYQFRVGVRYLIEVEAGSNGMVSMCGQTRPIVAAQGQLEFLSTQPGPDRPRVFGRVSAADVKGQGLGWPGGPPVEAAAVTLDGPVRVRQTTGADGAFSIRGVPDGNYRLSVTVPADRDDVSAPAPTEVTLTSDTACVNVDLVAPSTSQVTGTVVDSTGAPAPGVFVEIFPAPYNQWAGGFVHGAASGADGRFTIERLPPGRYVGGIGVPVPSPDRAVAPALARDVSGSPVLDIAPGAVLAVAPIVARPAPQVTVAGRTVAPPGTPLRARMLVLQPLDGLATARAYGGMTAEDGSFAMNAHRGVRYRVLVEDGEAVVGRAEFVAGDVPLEIRLDPPR